MTKRENGNMRALQCHAASLRASSLLRRLPIPSLPISFALSAMEIEAGKSGAPEIKGLFRRNTLTLRSPRRQQIVEAVSRSGIQRAGGRADRRHNTCDGKKILSRGWCWPRTGRLLQNSATRADSSSCPSAEAEPRPNGSNKRLSER